MIMRVDKYHSFGIKKVDSIAKQIQPKTIFKQRVRKTS